MRTGQLTDKAEDTISTSKRPTLSLTIITFFNNRMPLVIPYQGYLQDSKRWRNHKHSQYHHHALYNEADELLEKLHSLLNFSHPVLEVLPLKINT